jgi:hypothetical protein
MHAWVDWVDILQLSMSFPVWLCAFSIQGKKFLGHRLIMFCGNTSKFLWSALSYRAAWRTDRSINFEIYTSSVFTSP